KNKGDYILTGGLVANLFLKTRGYELGEVNDNLLEKKGFTKLIPRINKLLEKYGSKIVLPDDLAVDDGGRKEIRVSELPIEKPIKDIGSLTVRRYSELIEQARTVVMNGPMGVFEERGFEEATRKVFEAIASSRAFSLIGGGHTIAAASKLGYLDKFSHVSTGGGALIEYIVKGTLPVIEVLKKYSR
ncbi:MAG: phosphoglycerate kinase, partial [Thermoprotei archaeon]